MKLELFIQKCIDNRKEFSTQVYETFSECIIEYLRYYKESLNKLGVELIKKGLNLLSFLVLQSIIA